MHRKQNSIMASIKQVMILVVITFIASCKEQDLISKFPIEHYNQEISHWFKKTDTGYSQALLSADAQKKHLAIFYQHYTGSLSPWNKQFVSKILSQPYPDDVGTLEKSKAVYFDNRNKLKNKWYGLNFQAYDGRQIENIKQNINFSQFQDLHYNSNNRAITVDNLQGRALPTDDVFFYHHKIAGQGYPFDQMQVSALWAGTPVYILGETHDHAWMLVLTADYVAWVKSKGIARTDASFVNRWTRLTNRKLAAITKPDTSLLDEQKKLIVSAQVGSVFPVVSVLKKNVMIGVVDADRHYNAIIKTVSVSTNNAVVMPLTVSQHHITQIMSALIGRPYGWGNLYFYNDCSAELKSLFTPFGIWLPRHSEDQLLAGKVVDVSELSPEKRLSYLMSHGKRFFTIVYVGGHVFLYMGNFVDTQHGNAPIAMTYQNVWGLYPEGNQGRAVIGKSVLLPLLLKYPEDTHLLSLLERKYFKVIFL